jgi:two-component system sensor histidine kinase/response regulator
MLNLLGNAVKFTHAGHIRFGYHIHDENSIKFFVEDTGIGISPDQTGVIFQPFRQADNNSTREYGGTGLGLAISQGLAKLMGGIITVESKPGLGSSFYFELPFKQGQNSKDETEQIESRYCWTDKSILIVEDDEINCKYLKEILTPTGVKAQQVLNGIDALEAVGNNKFDLVIMDIRLPLMNGLEATRRIREAGNDVAIIAQTAYAMDEDRKACIDAGCNDYLAKPVKREDLLQIIAQYMP